MSHITIKPALRITDPLALPRAGRCSITLGVLGGSKPRTCMSCGLKALADSQGDVSQLEERTLRQTHCCWMCGGAWIVL